MGTKELREWKCDVCEHVELLPKESITDNGWGQFRYNFLNPLGSSEADGWYYLVICRECVSIFEKFVQDKDVPGIPPEPTSFSELFEKFFGPIREDLSKKISEASKKLTVEPLDTTIAGSNGDDTTTPNFAKGDISKFI